VAEFVSKLEAANDPARTVPGRREARSTLMRPALWVVMNAVQESWAQGHPKGDGAIPENVRDVVTKIDTLVREWAAANGLVRNPAAVDDMHLTPDGGDTFAATPAANELRERAAAAAREFAGLPDRGWLRAKTRVENTPQWWVVRAFADQVRAHDDSRTAWVRSGVQRLYELGLRDVAAKAHRGAGGDQLAESIRAVREALREWAAANGGDVNRPLRFPLRGGAETPSASSPAPAPSSTATDSPSQAVQQAAPQSAAVAESGSQSPAGPEPGTPAGSEPPVSRAASPAPSIASTVSVIPELDESATPQQWSEWVTTEAGKFQRSNPET